MTPIDSIPNIELDESLELVPDVGTVATLLPSPAARHRSMIYLAGSLAGGNVLASLLRVIGGLVQARLVTPNVLGLFSSVGLVQGYLPFLHLAIPNGLNRELPYFIGKGEHQRVRELAGAAQAWALLTAGGVVFLMLGGAVWCLVRGDLWLAAAWVSNAFLAFYSFYGTFYLQTTYRTGHDFAKLAFANVVQNAVALVLVVLVALLSFYGLCLRAVLSSAAGLALLYYWRPLRVGPQWSTRHLKHLFVVGR